MICTPHWGTCSRPYEHWWHQQRKRMSCCYQTHADADHIPYPWETGTLGWETTYQPITSLQQLLWGACSPTAKRLLHSFTAFSNLINAVLGRGSSSDLQTPCARKVLKSLQTTLKSSFHSFYRLSFVFPLPLLTRSICRWKTTEKSKNRKKIFVQR